MHTIKFFAAGILAAIAVSRSHRAGGGEGISYLHYTLMVSIGVGIFVLAGDGFGTAFADYDGTENPWNHTHEVSFRWHTIPLAETDSSYGIRYHSNIDVIVNPPFHFSDAFVNVQIIGAGATYGEDYILFLPNKTGSTDTKVLRLPVGKDVVPIAISVRNDHVSEDTEVFTLKLKPAEYGSYYTVGSINEVEVAVYDHLPVRGSGGYTVTGRDNADPNRGIHIQPDKIALPIGGNASYGISLTSAPSHPVVVEAFRDVNGKVHNLGKSFSGVRVSPSLLNFTADNWYTQQFFTLNVGNSDPGRYVIIHGLTSLDSDYDSRRYFNGPSVIGHTHVVIDVTTNSAPPPRQEGGDSPRFPTSVALSLGDASVSEGAGTTTVTATLNAPAPPDGVSVSLYASGGNATDGTDYTVPGSIYISAGDRSGSAPITITDDTVAESSERAVITVFAEIFGQAMTDSITLTIVDNDGVIVVEQTNRAPTISSAISDVSGLDAGDSRTISLDSVFDDADGDSLAITTTSSNGSVATVEAASDGSALTITAQAPGTATIRVTAQDAGGSRVTDSFTVTVDAQQPADVPEPDSMVARYDTDGSGAIEQDEWVKAKEDYAGGKLTNEEIYAISKARA